MAIVKGYFNTKNNAFLGVMMAKNGENGAVSTPRYVEGVCFGEYNTETDEFVPLTNPMVIPKGQVMYRDEDQEAFLQGKHKETVTGIEEDKGAEFAMKKVFSMQKPTPKPKKKLITPSDQDFKVEGIDISKLF